jgi:nucleotidyltransferase substrate binding protein (TIGR01987 family)
MKLELSSLRNAIRSLEKALQITADKIVQEDVSTDEIDLMKAGVIQNFEFSYELCWKSMKRWIEYNVGSEIVDGVTRKELFRRGLENKLISDIDIWMEFHRARNISSHIYDDKTAEEVYEIAAKFLDYAKKLLDSLESRND